MRSQYQILSLVLVLSVCLALPAMAQRIEDAKPAEKTVEVDEGDEFESTIQRPDPVEVVAQQLDFLQRELSLTPKQATKIEPVLMDRAVKLNKYIGVVQTDVDKHLSDRNAINKIHRQAENKIVKILNKEQNVRYEELKAEEFAKRGRKPAEPEAKPADPDA